MLFKRKQIFSQHKVQAHSPLLTTMDLQQMLKNEYLYEKNAFHLIGEGSQQLRWRDLSSDEFARIVSQIEEAFAHSQTLIIKELENWNSAIQEKGRALGDNPDVHLYLSPPRGSSFDWHADDRDVYILMQKGEKLFEVEEPDFSIGRYLLSAGDELYIPYGAKHRAMASDQVSYHLSFGFWPENFTIHEGYQELKLSPQLNL